MTHILISVLILASLATVWVNAETVTTKDGPTRKRPITLIDKVKTHIDTIIRTKLIYSLDNSEGTDTYLQNIAPPCRIFD